MKSHKNRSKIIKRLTDGLFKFSSQFNLLKNSIYVVAYSTGPDSTALLHLLSKWQARFKIKLIACYVNHLIRQESFEEEKLAQDFTKSLGVPLIIKRLLYSPRNEEEARRERYRLLKEVASHFNTSSILTAHNADDVAETAFFQLLRGSSPFSLVGIKPSSQVFGLNVEKPLLFATKPELEEYCNLLSLPFNTDKTNLDPATSKRNLIRLEIFPRLKDINPKFQRQLFFFCKANWETEDKIEEIEEVSLIPYIDSTTIVIKSLPPFSKPLLFFTLKKLGIQLNSQQLEEATSCTSLKISKISKGSISAFIKPTYIQITLPISIISFVKIEKNKTTLHLSLPKLAPITLAPLQNSKNLWQIIKSEWKHHPSKFTFNPRRSRLWRSLKTILETFSHQYTGMKK